MRPVHILALCLLTASPALGQETAATPGGEVRATLIDGWRRADGSRMAGIEISMSRGWHTYWRVPGEAGVPPEFDWSKSTNLASADLKWPRPVVFDNYGSIGFGYADKVVLPVVLTPRDPSAPIGVDLRMFLGICGQICMPANLGLTEEIRPDAAKTGAAEINAALADMPHRPGEAGVTHVSCSIAEGADGLELTTEVTFAAVPTRDQVTVIEPGQRNLWIGLAQSQTIGRKVVSRAPLEAVNGAGPIIDRSALRLTLLDPDRAVDIQGCAAPG